MNAVNSAADAVHRNKMGELTSGKRGSLAHRATVGSISCITIQGSSLSPHCHFLSTKDLVPCTKSPSVQKTEAPAPRSQCYDAKTGSPHLWNTLSKKQKSRHALADVAKSLVQYEAPGAPAYSFADCTKAEREDRG